MGDFMKKIFIIFTLAICLVSNVNFIRANESEIDLVEDAKSAVLIDLNNEIVMYNKEMNTRFPPASMTKIMSMFYLPSSPRRTALFSGALLWFMAYSYNCNKSLVNQPLWPYTSLYKSEYLWQVPIKDM